MDFGCIVDSLCDMFDSSSNDELLDDYFGSVPIMGGTSGIESMFGAGDDENNSNENSTESSTPDTGV